MIEKDIGGSICRLDVSVAVGECDERDYAVAATCDLDVRARPSDTERKERFAAASLTT